MENAILGCFSLLPCELRHEVGLCVADVPLTLPVSVCLAIDLAENHVAAEVNLECVRGELIRRSRSRVDVVCNE